MSETMKEIKIDKDQPVYAVHDGISLLKDHIEDLNSKYNAKLAEHVINVDEKFSVIKGEMAIIRDSFIDCKEKLKGHTSMIAVNSNEIKELNKKLEVEAIIIQKVSTDIASLNENIIDINDKIRSINENMDNMNIDIENTNKKIKRSNNIMKNFIDKFNIIILILFFIMLGFPIVSSILFIKTSKMLDRIERLETEYEIKYPGVIYDDSEEEPEEISKITC